MEDITYQRDNIGNITQTSDAVANRTAVYAYDPLYRLTTVDSSDNSEDRGYTYDAVGNRLALTENGTTYHYAYSVGNRLTAIRTGSPAGPLYRQFSYDDAGRILEKKNGTGTPLYSVTYNGKGRAGNINGNLFSYDPGDYRIEKNSQFYHLEGEHLEAVYSASGTLQEKYLRGAVVDEIVNGYRYHSADANDWTNYSFHHDHLNSVTALTGHAGAVEQTWKYDAFGKPLVTAIPGTGNSMLYTGREYDAETGLYYYRARYYDPEIGRFISEDPKGFGAGVNFYAYVGNNPVNGNDPTGLAPANLNKYAKELVNNKGMTDVEKLASMMNFAKQDNSGNAYAAINDLTDVLSGGVPLISERSPYYVPGFGASGFKPEYADESNQVRHFIGSLSAGYNFGLPVGVASVYANEIIHGQPLTGPDLNLGVMGVDMGANINKIDNWGGAVLQKISVGSAGGGFVLYPNKPNTNMMTAVYSK